MAEANLDALIRELESDASDSQEDTEMVGSQSEGDDIPLIDIPMQLPPDPGQQVPGSPLKSPLIAKYISSSSARRRILKATDCNFCHQEHDRGPPGV